MKLVAHVTQRYMPEPGFSLTVGTREPQLLLLRLVTKGTADHLPLAGLVSAADKPYLSLALSERRPSFASLLWMSLWCSVVNAEARE